MEIRLLAADRYGIKDWDGTVELQGLKSFQMKRLSNSRSVLTVLRKTLRVCNGEMSPIQLPEEIKPENLELAHFMQILVGLVALSGGRQTQKTYTCENCNALNPRVIDTIKVFSVKEPKNSAVRVETGSEEIPEVTFITIGQFLNAHKALDTISEEELHATFGELYDLSNEDDVEDMKEMIFDFAGLAAAVPQKADTVSEHVLETTKKFALLPIETLQRIRETIEDLSGQMNKTYRTKCSNCRKIIKEDLEETEYFFGGR